MKEKNLLTQEIASKIKQLMEEKNLSQRRLANKSGIKEGYLGYLLRGKKRFNLIHIEKICAALNYPVAKLFEDNVISQEETPPNQADPKTSLEEALLGMFRRMSPRHRGDLIGYTEELLLSEAIPRRESKKAGAAQD